ncbi:MAG: helix-turn-helix transcriptional regulator [Oscillospiraceae bacterium]|nr:helix-turn-helix transcriptional regulator [Oscillospiraceae bacterium]
MTFSETIKQIRQKHFLSQEAFAKELGVSFATVNRWESGKTKPTYKTMKLLDDYCKKNGIIFDISAECMGVKSDEQ